MVCLLRAKTARIFRSITDEPWKGYFFLTVSAIVLFSIFAFLSGRLQNFFLGEDFFVFHWAETHNYLDAIKEWYLDNGRPINAIYWISEYKLIGYRPDVIHLISFILHAISVALATLAIFKVWPERRRAPFLASLFILTVFFFPHAMNWTLQLASDHIYLGQIFLFISVLLVQKWVLVEFRNRWLVLGFIFYLLAIFTYESIFLLFPIVLFLTIPLLPANLAGKRKLAQLGLLALISLFLGFIPLYIYSQLRGSVHPAFYNNPTLLNQIPERIQSSLTMFSSYFTDFNAYLATNNQYAQLLVLVISVVVLTVTVYLVNFLIAKRKTGGSDLFGLTKKDVAVLALYVSAFWLIFMSLVPYALGGFAAHPRLYTLPIYGFSLFLVLAFSLFTVKFMRLAVVSISICIIALGLSEFYAYSQSGLDVEFIPEMNYLSLTGIVPGVKESSVFLFVDFEMGLKVWNGCSLALRMFYDTRDLRCLYLSSNDLRAEATRTDAGLMAEGGNETTENYIIIGVDSDGALYIIPEITPISDVLIDWESERPIKTDYRRIIMAGKPTSQMYFQLLTRWKGQ